MKKRFLSYFLALMMVFAVMHIPVSAHQGISFSSDFSGYELKENQWNGTTVTTGGAMPDNFETYKAQQSYHGAYAATAKDAKYGTSVKVYQEYEPNSSAMYAGFKYTFPTKPENSFYMSVSMNVESTADGKYTQRSIRMQSATGTIVPILFEGSVIKTFGTNTGVQFSTDKWYDFKLWMNSNTGYYTTEVWSDGVKLATVTNSNDGLAKISPVNRIEFFHNAACNSASSWTYKDSAGNTVVKEPQVTYYDNFEFKTIDRYEVDETASSSHTVLDFETIDLTSKETIKKYMNDKGVFDYGYQGAGEGMDLESVTTDRGKGVRIVPWVIPADSDKYTVSDGVVYDKETGAQLYARNRMLYNCIYYTRNSSNYITDAMYFKTAFKFEDKNFGTFGIGISGNYYREVITAGYSGMFKIFGKDTGINLKTDKWYDVEGRLDTDTGYYIISIAEEGGEFFEAIGFTSSLDEASVGAYAGNYRLSLNYWNRSTNNDWSIPTAMIVDNMQFGPVSKLKAPIKKNYAFESAKELEEFAVSGGTGVVSDGEMKVMGSTEAETNVEMAMPFTTTTFKYSADVTLDDMNVDRTLAVRNHVKTTAGVRTTDAVDVVKFGADGKLCIGGTEVADVSLGAGEYTVDVVFNQVEYNATVKIIKDGAVIAEETAPLGTKTVKIIYLDWKMSTGESATIFDNIAYSTIYNFEIDAKFSTTGTDRTFTAADDVVVKFSNPIDKTAFTKDKITINTNAAIKGIEFVDDYTAKLVFDKVQGTHYYIKFTDVLDIYGNILTDYIEFDTIKQDLVMTATSFRRNGEVLSLSSAGDVTAAFTAQGNNGKTFDMLYVLCMYEGGNLIETVHDVFTVDAEKEEHTLNITIPNDGKYYILKAFLWDAETLEPIRDPEVLKPISDQPIAIPKLDDMNSNDNVLKAFERALSFAEENNIKMSFGLIVKYLEYGATEETRARILNFYNHPLIELWSHAYNPSIKPGDATDEEQEEDFKLANDTAAKYGITFKTFGPPSGSLNEYTGVMLNKYNFKVLMSYNLPQLEEWGLLDESNTFITVHPEKFNLEPTATGNTRDLEELKEMWLTACENGDEVAILQVHPNSWSGYEGSEQRYYDFLLWLKARGVVFMTFEEYVDYISVL